MIHRRAAFLLFGLMLLGGGILFAAESRKALVVGNQKYEASIGPLRNTGNDAKAMARALRALGFSVMERHDLNRDQLLKAVDDFRKALPGAEVGLFYYAGHGLAVNGMNYLVPIKSGFAPVDVDEATLRVLAETRLFNAEQAVADMATAGARCNLVILDACRTTRLPSSVRTREAGTRGGLAEMTPPAGSLIAFATDAGRTAFDGDGANGLYTEELIKNLTRPGLTIEQVFKRTRAGVLKRSDGGQMPAEYSRLVGEDIYLAGDMPVAAAIAVATPTPVPVEKSEVELIEEAGQLAAAGQAKSCVEILEVLARKKGAGEYAYEPLDTLLTGVKDQLKDANGPSSKAVTAAETCELVLKATPTCLPADTPRTVELTARATSRRGDALFLLGRHEEALKCYEEATKLDSEDAYFVYNRGRARSALGDRAAAREDYRLAVTLGAKQPGARKLAEKALAEEN